MRLSTSPGDVVPDGIAAARGMAVKVIGVDGPKLLAEARNALIEDFAMPTTR